MGVGDLLAQTAVEGRSVGNLDWKRASQFSAVGFIVVVNKYYLVLLGYFLSFVVGSLASSLVRCSG